ncbi:MAG: phosphatase domain-containing protein [Ginsengibacter sp.]
MQNLNDLYKEKKLSIADRIKNKLFVWFRLSNKPVVKVYRGYGNPAKFLVFGHVLHLSAYPRKKYKRGFVKNTFSMLRLFMVKPSKFAKLKLVWDGNTYEAMTEDDGFYKFEVECKNPLAPGWYNVEVELLDPRYKLKAPGEFFVPYVYEYAFISDIDDTFLISHSSNLRKRLYVLLTKNARSRKPFEGVVNHYQLLAATGAAEHTERAFFFVSSSEWNLYDYILEFARNNKLPKGVYLLNQMKLFHQLWKTGQNNHATKFMRIARIMEAYPDQKFVLFGDDSQEDPNIYSRIIEYFPGKIYSVYLRHVHKSNWERVKKIVEKLEALGVRCCYFRHSAEAIAHSKENGLIARDIG